MMIVVDAVTVLGLGFEYVLPVVLALPQFELAELATALGISAFFVVMQALFLPVIAFLYAFPSGEG